MRKLSLLTTVFVLTFTVGMSQTDTTTYEKEKEQTEGHMDHMDKDKKAHMEKDKDVKASEAETKTENYTKANTEVSGDTEDFINDAAEGMLKEIQLAQMAIQTDKVDVPEEIVQFGQNIIEDHTQANLDLKGIAQGMDVDMPAFINPDDIRIEHQKDLNELQELEGANFYGSFIERMILEHESLIEDFEKAQVEVENEEVNAWIDDTLPKLKDHLHKAQNLQAKMSAGELVEE